MIKSELIETIAAENPHLYQRDVEKIVNAILDTITTALARGDRGRPTKRKGTNPGRSARPNGGLRTRSAADRGRARTCTLQLRRLMLYPVERRGRMYVQSSAPAS